MEPNDQEALAGPITDLVSSPESQSLDFEAKLDDQDQAAKLISAMANGGGGTIVLGVEETEKPVGLADPAKTTKVAIEAAQTLSPVVELAINQAEVEGQHIAVVEVPPGSQPVLPPKGPLVKRSADGKTEVMSGADVERGYSRAGATRQGFDKLNKRLAETEKKLEAAIKKGPPLKAQLPGFFIGGFIGAVIGVGLTTLIGL